MTRRTSNSRRSKVLIVFVTTPAKRTTAMKIARGVVADRLAACVNIVPLTCSVYRWEGKICVDREFLLVMKTVRSAFPSLRRRILELHPYDVPEVVALTVTEGDARYLTWLRDSVQL